MSRLLVVDEDAGHRLILRSRLSEAGHEIVVAESAAKGLSQAREGGFHAVLVCGAFAGLEPAEMCRRLVAMPEIAAVPVIVCAEQSPAVEEIARCYEAGAEAVVARAELPALEHVLRVAERHRARVKDLAQQVAALSALRGKGTERAAEPEPAHALDHAAALREFALGHPEGVLVVDADGHVRNADRGACEMLGARVEGASLGSLVPASGLEAFVRDARTEHRERIRFDLKRQGRPTRALSAVVVPILMRPNDHGPALRVVLLQDALRRRAAAEALKMHEPALPRAEAAVLVDAAREVYRPESIPGRGEASVRLREETARAAMHRDPVLVLGDPESGVERIARILHYTGNLVGSFVPVRCGALTPEALDVELFGTARNGNGGCGDRPGLVHLALDGTLFLQDVVETSPETQERLLRLVREGSVQRRGASRPERVEVRVVASSRIPLTTAVAEKRFSAELAEELGACTLVVPSLEARRADLRAIVDAFVKRHGAARGVTSIATDAFTLIDRRSWNGDAAELEESIAQAAQHAVNGEIRASDLPRWVHDSVPSTRGELIPRRTPVEHAAATTHAVSGLAQHELTPARSQGAPRESRAWDIGDDEPVSLQLYEKKALLRAIAHCGGDKLAAAKLLRLGKSTLYRKLKRYGIK